MMTQEEAIINLEKLIALFHTASEQSKMVDYSKIIETLEFAAAALRPISREQVEEAWRGEFVPAESDFDDDDTLFDVEDWCDWQCSACHNEICYDDPMERKWLPKFCPNCGAPMTDEAVQIVMKRLEALRDEWLF